MMRTKKDVRRFASNTEFIANNSAKFGCVNVSDLDNDRVERALEHDWIDSDLNLTRDGKAIIMNWQDSSRPRQKLERLGAPNFIQDGYDLPLEKDDLGERDYHQVSVKVDPAETCPTGHEDYIERDIRAGKTDLDIMGHALARGNHVHLKGHTGTGKTMAAKHFAQQTGHGVRQVNFSEEVRMSYLFGHYEVYEENGATEMRWVDGELTKAVRNGEWFIADEGNMMSGDVSSALHSAIEKGDAKFTIPEKGEVIDVHDDFRLIMTSNPRYAGTKPLNKAFANRFVTIEFEYLSQSDEVDVVMANTQLEQNRRNDVESLVSLGSELRDDFERGEIPQPVTPRTLIRAAEFLEDGFMDLEDAAKTAIVDAYPEEFRNPVETVIENCI